MPAYVSLFVLTFRGRNVDHQHGVDLITRVVRSEAEQVSKNHLSCLRCLLFARLDDHRRRLSSILKKFFVPITAHFAFRISANVNGLLITQV